MALIDHEILNSEAWRPIEGFEGVYAVSVYGEVYSFRLGRRLKAYLNKDGYPRVTLVRPGDGTLVERKVHPRVHRLVAMAFKGDKRNALHCEVAHLDGNRTNACIDNLKWVSKIENHSHRFAHGTNCAGEKHPSAKLTDEAVRIIRKASGPAFRKELAARFGVSEHAINDVRSRRRWAHVK